MRSAGGQGRASTVKFDIRFRLRIRRGDTVAVGPGKIALLEAVGATGSIAAAARALDMSYRRAWMLIDDMNRSLREPVVSTSAGGPRGGGAVLSASGEQVIALYREVEAKARRATAREIAALSKLLNK